MSRLERLARDVVAELGDAHWYPGYTTKDKPPPQPRSVELLRRYLRIVDSKNEIRPTVEMGRLARF